MSDQSPPAPPEPPAAERAAAAAAAAERAAPEQAVTQLAPQPGSRAVLWALLVLGAFLALGALWFALFGNPRVIGLDAGDVLGSSSATSTSAVTTPTVPLAPDDVKAVLAEIDYAESSDASTTEFNDMILHAVAGVDLAAFAQSTLESAQSIWWVEPSTDIRRTLTGAEKNAIVAESIAAWLSREQSIGETSTLSDVLGVRLYAPSSVDRIRPDSLFEVLGQGLAPLGLMFGAHDPDDAWTWRVEQVTVTGPTTADVTYSASVKPDAGWRFVDPSVSYVKHLTFSTTAGGGWRLAGWSNYAEVRSRFDANITPPGSVTAIDEWWGSL